MLDQGDARDSQQTLSHWRNRQQPLARLPNSRQSMLAVLAAIGASTCSHWRVLDACVFECIMGASPFHTSQIWNQIELRGGLRGFYYFPSLVSLKKT